MADKANGGAIIPSALELVSSSVVFQVSEQTFL
jgi:hypothetical protein